MPSPKVILVTGSSTGFGRHLVENILADGNIAVATLRTPSAIDDLKAQFGEDRLLVLPLDVTKTSDIKNAFARVREVYGRCDAVISNAGFSGVAEAEATPEKVIRDMFDVNVLGAIELSKQAVAFFRENPTMEGRRPGGHFVSISSMAGVTVTPGTSVYAATKHAIEAYTEALGQELDPRWNIKVTSICPSLFRTNVVNNSPVLPPHPSYSNPALPSNYLREMVKASASGQFGADPAKGAKAILGVIAREGAAPIRVPLGAPAIDGFRKKAAELLAQADEWEELARSME